MYVCICYVLIYIYAECMYVCMYVCMYICMNVFMNILYVCMYILDLKYMYVCVYMLCIDIQYIFMLYVCMYVCMYVCVYPRLPHPVGGGAGEGERRGCGAVEEGDQGAAGLRDGAAEGLQDVFGCPARENRRRLGGGLHEARGGGTLWMYGWMYVCRAEYNLHSIFILRMHRGMRVCT